MKGDYHTKMFTFIDKKKSKHHIRLKCIRKELNQTRKNIEIITYTCKRVFSDTFYFLYKICYVATFKVILLQILYRKNTCTTCILYQTNLELISGLLHLVNPNHTFTYIRLSALKIKTQF